MTIIFLNSSWRWFLSTCYGNPITTDELSMLRRENFTLQMAQFVALFGFSPLPFSSGVKERV